MIIATDKFTENDQEGQLMITNNNKNTVRRLAEYEECKSLYQHKPVLFRWCSYNQAWQLAQQTDENFPLTIDDKLDFCSDALQFYLPYASAYLLESIDSQTLDKSQLEKYSYLQCMTYLHINSEAQVLDYFELDKIIQNMYHGAPVNKLTKSFLSFIFLYYQISKSTYTYAFILDNPLYVELLRKNKTITVLFDKGYRTSLFPSHEKDFCEIITRITDLLANVNNTLNLEFILQNRYKSGFSLSQLIEQMTCLVIAAPINHDNAQSQFEIILGLKSKHVPTDFTGNEIHARTFRRLERAFIEKQTKSKQCSRFRMNLFSQVNVPIGNKISGPDTTIFTNCNAPHSR